jgi:hypothetical protein
LDFGAKSAPFEIPPGETVQFNVVCEYFFGDTQPIDIDLYLDIDGSLVTKKIALELKHKPSDNSKKTDESVQ